TTPWTLPSNLALAIGYEVKYASHVQDGVSYIASIAALNKLFGTDYNSDSANIIDLAYRNLTQTNSPRFFKYKPLFEYFSHLKTNYICRLYNDAGLDEQATVAGRENL